MPRTSFPSSMLSGASGGMSKLAAALAGGNDTYQDAYDKEALTQSRIAQALSSIRTADAAAAAHQAKADQDRAETAVLQGRGDLFNEQVANASGVDVPMVLGYRQRLRTGVAPQVPMGPETADGQMGIGSMQVPAGAETKIAQALKQFMPLLANMKDMKPDDLAKADQIYGDTGLRDQVLAGTLKPGALGAAQAARDGKPLFHSGAGGEVLGLFDGGVDTSNPMAQSTLTLRREQAGAQRANAAQSYAAADASRASADNSRASAAKTRAEMEQGIRTGDIQVVTGEDGSVMLVNKRNGLSRPATGMDGKPINSGGKPMTEGQAKALLFGERARLAEETLGKLAAKGVDQPGIIKRTAEGAGQIIGLGTSFGDVLGSTFGTWTNGTQSAAQQQVEQAQRDFINAVLRRESGAVISPIEFDNAIKQYFPQINDDKATRDLKRRNRETAIRGILAEVPSNRRQLPALPGAPAAPAPAPRQGGASGGWEASAAPAGRNVVVDY